VKEVGFPMAKRTRAAQGMRALDWPAELRREKLEHPESIAVSRPDADTASAYDL
jgi:hypothetical protein